MNYETARANMIEQQIRPWNVLEMRTLNALGQVRREDYVPEKYRELAFADIQIPLADGEVMLEPKVGARMVEAMHLTPDSRVLEIGTGTGYLTALMACMCSHVTGIEISAELADSSKRNLAMAGIDNISIVHSDCFDYCQAPDQTFDAVLITGSVPVIGHEFLDLISSSGCVVGIQGNNPAMQAVRVSADGVIKTLFETSVKRLRNTDNSVSFTF